MKPIIKRPSSPIRRNRPEPRTGARRAEAGYALIVVMIAVTVLIIGLLTVLPSTYQEARREREEELIFRGNQYARAIYLFQQRFRRYPSSVNELLHTNNLSFLRKPWPDPMTPKGKWRFIHATASGAVLDSWTLSQQLGPPPLGQPPTASAQGGLGTSQPGGSLGSSNTTSPGSSGPSGQPPSGRPVDASGKPIPSPDCLDGGQSESTSTSFPTGTLGALGGAIVGVASCSDAASLRVYNKYSHYSEWEFLGVGFMPVLGAGVAPTAPVTTPLGPGGQFGPSGAPGVPLPPTTAPGEGGAGGGAMIPAPPGTPEVPTQPLPNASGAPQQ